MIWRRLTEPSGVVLVTALLLAVAVILAGTAAYLTTSNEMKITGNYKKGFEAMNLAESAISEVTARLIGKATSDHPYYAGDPASTPNANWCAYISTDSGFVHYATEDGDPDYDSGYTNYFPAYLNPAASGPSANSRLAEVIDAPASYWVKVRHKTEADLLYGDAYTDNGSTDNDVIYWGFPESDSMASLTYGYFTSDTTQVVGRPVEMVRAYGFDGNSKVEVDAELVYQQVCPPIVAACYAEGDMTGDGTGLTVNGAPISQVYIFTGDPPTPAYVPALVNGPGDIEVWSGTRNLDVLAGINRIAPYADVIDGDLYSTTLAAGIYIYDDESDTTLDLVNVTGEGILLSRDPVTFDATNWSGIVLVVGDTSLESGSSVTGATLVEGEVAVSGGPTIAYGENQVADALALVPMPPSIKKWRQVF